MPCARAEPRSDCRPTGSVRAVMVLIAGVASLLGAAGAGAQSAPPGLIAPGNAAVTGFSGALPPAQIAPGVNPVGFTFIDVDGPALRIVDLQNMGGPPDARLVIAPKPFTITAAQIGQVFAVALDNAVPPNIYAAASSAYGLHIVRPGRDDRLTHARVGLADTSFMPGMWGQASADGGPGSIWKIDGVTGAVTLFANVTRDGVANSGPALGGLAFDPDSNSLFVADRETGLIHRFNVDGVEIGRFDHGIQGRAAAGLPVVAGDPPKRLDITSPQFDSTQPATWNYAAPARRVFGLGVRAGRLYYAVADGLEIWSAAIAPDGLADPTLEIRVPPAAGPTEISKITFDDQGRMLLAERPDPSGAYDFGPLTQEGVGRVLRYAIAGVHPGVARAWQPVPDQYAIGFARDLRNGNGGVAVGFDYDRTGRIDRGACGGFLWSTGEQLRRSADPALVARLSQGGPSDVDGLQGNYLWTIRPRNAPPLESHVVDYDDRFDDAAVRGHMGDVAIWRICGPVLRGGWMLPSWYVGQEGSGRSPPPPRLTCPPDQQQPGFQCCPKGTSPDAGGACKPWCPNGKMDANSQNLCRLGFDSATYDAANPGKLTCIGGSAPDIAKGILGCVGKSPVLSPAACPAGWSKQDVPNIGRVCAPTAAQLQCGPDQQVSGIDDKCHTLCLGGTAWPARQCCAPGASLTPTGECCPAGAGVDARTGQCRRTRSVCPAGSKRDPVTGICAPPGGTCPAGTSPDPNTGACGKLTSTCLPGLTADPLSGDCKKPPPPPTACPPGQSAGPNGLCRIVICAAPGRQVGGACCSPGDLKPGGACAMTVCGAGRAPAGASNACCDGSRIYTDRTGAQACCATRLVNGQCQPAGGSPVLPGCSPGSTDPNCCANGYKWAGNSCCLASRITSAGQCCPAGQTPSRPNKDQCQPGLASGMPPFGQDGPGATGGQCCAAGSIPTASGVCCVASQVTSAGVCCPAGQRPDPRNRRACVPSQSCAVRETLVNGACCPNPQLYKDGAGNPQCCPQMVDQNGRCAPEPRLPPQCFAGYTMMPDGSCCANAWVGRDGRSCAAPGRQQQFPPPSGPNRIAPIPPPPPQARPVPPPDVQPVPPRRLRPPPPLRPSPRQVRPPSHPQFRTPQFRPPPFRAAPMRRCVVFRGRPVCR